MDKDIAIRNTHSQVVTIRADKYGFDADGNSVDIDEAKVNTEMKRLQAEYDSQKYIRQRKAEYPSIEECIHAILDDGLEELQAKRQAVKQKYKKG